MPDNLNTVNSTIPLYIVICTLARSGNFLNKYKSSLAMRYLTPLINSVFYYNFQLFLHEMKVFCSKLYQCQKWKKRLICNFLNGTTPVFFNLRISVKLQIFVQSWRREANVLQYLEKQSKLPHFLFRFWYSYELANRIFLLLLYTLLYSAQYTSNNTVHNSVHFVRTWKSPHKNILWK